jgi:hypothetical protein
MRNSKHFSASLTSERLNRPIARKILQTAISFSNQLVTPTNRLLTFFLYLAHGGLSEHEQRLFHARFDCSASEEVRAKTRRKNCFEETLQFNVRKHARAVRLSKKPHPNSLPISFIENESELD